MSNPNDTLHGGIPAVFADYAVGQLPDGLAHLSAQYRAAELAQNAVESLEKCDNEFGGKRFRLPGGVLGWIDERLTDQEGFSIHPSTPNQLVNHAHQYHFASFDQPRFTILAARVGQVIFLAVGTGRRVRNPGSIWPILKPWRTWASDFRPRLELWPGTVDPDNIRVFRIPK